MIPKEILDHLHAAGVPFVVHPHRRAVTGQELAASVHVTGYRVAKSVLLEADGRRLIAVLPAAETVDIERVAAALGTRRVRLMREEEFTGLFPGCDLGAEPPFGSLYGLPVLADRSLAGVGSLIVRAGSHEEALELRYEDFARLEHPDLADFAVLRHPVPRATQEGRWP